MIYTFKDFINEEKEINNNIIYFFHPRMFFETKAEEQATELINLYFDNPMIYNLPETKKSYYDSADEVNKIVVLPHTDGTISPRTFRRISYAFERGVDAYYLHPQQYKIMRIEDLDFFQNKTMSKEEWQEKIKTDNSENYFKEAFE